jgi:AbrB family looped-hinge helix DNA binding protein
MALASSKLTRQGQISVPAEVRKKLGVGPGSVLEWQEEGDRIVVRRAGKYTSTEVHDAVFRSSPPKPRSVEELKAGIRQSIKKRHARR